MREMEGGMRSGGVIKKKSSSGCLIIKKKTDVLGSGVGSSHKEKKRPRIIASQSGSSDESLEPVRRKFKEGMQNGGAVYGRRVEEDREFRRSSEMVDSERKRNRMELFEFDEYDEFDGKKMRNDFMGMVGRSGNSREFVGGSGRKVMVDKRKHAYYDGSSSGVSGRNRTVAHGGKGRFDLEGDEAHLPISLLRLKYQEESAEPIRLQGKNGVLKVMVNKKKKMDLSTRTSYDRQVVDINRKGSTSEEAVKEETPVRPSYHSDSKRAEKGIAFTEKEKGHMKLQKQMLGKPNKAGDCEREKRELKLQKQLVGKSTKAGDNESDGTDTSLKLAPPSLEGGGGAKKAVKTETQRSLPSENVTPIKGGERNVTAEADNLTPAKGKDGKLKRGGSTEKQLLRERIREMLINSGWTIDYRPRRNRDYLDAVYINPSGTAYWSIIKAYDALQKQLQEDNEKNIADGVSSFTPLSDDLINKLTRQTRKKMEEEMKKKRRDVAVAKNSKKALVKDPVEDSDTDHHEEKLSSFIRQNAKSKKGRMHESNCEGGDDLSDDSQKHEQDKNARPSKSKSKVVQARKSRKIGRCTLLVRSSDKGPNSESDGYVPYTGKRTLLAWLIDSGTVQSSEKVQYMNRRKTRVKLEGWITRDGIHCGCCSKILTVSKFELHAGSKLRQPFQNIMLESGPSLLQCLIDAWNKQEESVRQDFHVVDVDSDDPDDDTCGICGDGGDLICCDGCPSTFHQSCLGIQMLPPGDWHCPNCTCKFCGTTGKIATEEGGTASELMMCSLCEKKYHKSCSKGMAAPLVLSNNTSASFCGKECQELHDHLQKIIGTKHELEGGFSWSLIQRTDLELDTTSRGFPQRVECNSKLAVALSVMDECFLPIVDRRSEINLIHNVLYNCGSNFSRLNFHGFYAMILERGDEIISAASIRIHGTQLAEMPFIGTRHIYRRQGMCRRLLSAIESVLCLLKVKKLIIPAISEHMHTWTVVFGFKQLEDSDKKEMKSMNMLVFPGTDMLQKKLLKPEIPEGMEVAESKGNSPQSLGLAKKSDIDSFGKQERNIQDDAGREHESIDKADAATAVPSNDVTVTRGLDDTQESNVKSPSKENMEIDDQLSKELVESADRLKCSSPSDAATDLQMRNTVASQDLLEDQSPGSLSTACGSAENSSEQNPEGGDPTVVEIQRKLQISEGALHEAVIEGGSIETRPSPLQENSLQNSTEKDSIPDSASPAPCTEGDPIIRFNSDLNEPVDGDVESEGHTLSGTVSDAKATNSDSYKNAQNMEEVQNEPSVASESDSGNEVDTAGDNTCELNAEGKADGTSVETILDSSTKLPQLLAADDMERSQNSEPWATSNGTSGNSVSCSPDLNQQAALIEAESLEAPETLHNVVAAAKSTAQTDGSNSTDDSHKLSSDGDHVDLAHGPVSLDQNRAETTMPSSDSDEGEGNLRS